MTATPTTPATLFRARFAVGAMFAVNGLTFANLVPRYPEIKAALGLDNAAFGTAIACWPLGALVSGLLAGAAVTRWTSARVTLVGSLIMVVLINLVAWAPSWLALAAVFFVVGLIDALIDIANNAHGLWVQRRLGTSIITSLHGVWSVGAVLGGLLGSAVAGFGVPVELHLLGTGVVFATLAIVFSRFLLPGPDPDDRPQTATPRRRRVSAALLARLLLIGAVGLAGAAGEDAGNTWGALYLTGVLGTSAALGGAAFVAMQGLMIVGRFGGDPLVTRYDAGRVSQVSALLMVVGLALVVAVPSVVTAVVGFGVVGLGIAVLIPLAMQAADELPGLPRGFGLAAAGWLMRVGFLVTPPLVGLLADATSLRWALLIPAVFGVVAVICARLLPARVHL